MEAKFINEFKRGQDPKRSMKIGSKVPYRIVENFVKALNSLGIESDFKESSEYQSDEIFDIIINYDDDWLKDDIFQINYASEEAAIREWGEDWQEGTELERIWGFIVYNENGDVLIEPTDDTKPIIELLVKTKYGPIGDRIKWHEKEIKKLQKIKQNLDKLK